jgi:hypothetical protein
MVMLGESPLTFFFVLLFILTAFFFVEAISIFLDFLINSAMLN